MFNRIQYSGRQVFSWYVDKGMCGTFEEKADTFVGTYESLDSEQPRANALERGASSMFPVLG